MNTEKKSLKIVISTTPIRPTPTDYPPLGSIAVIQSLRAAGYDPFFLDIDGKRPPFEEVEAYFQREQPDILGISAVVSTAYAYTKKLVRMVRRVSPKTRIMLGGNLAASAEILHRLTGIEYCVSGEGEVVVVNLVDYLADRIARGLPGDDHEALKGIRGISFLDRDGTMVFTGFETRIPAEELDDPDFSILEQYSRIENYISDPMTRPDFEQDPRSHQPHRRGKKMAQIITAKGCVARCTFCHRWDKGYRALPVQRIVKTIKYLQERYNVGFIQFGDENFGSDKRQVNALIEALKPLDILYNVGGVRCRTVDPDLLRRLKESGCTAVYYGMETGSPRILEVMEKNATREHNMNAARWTVEAGIYNIYQLVLGMPGESFETIRETTEFFQEATAMLDESPLNRLSINFIQALPGTPVYEYARHKGLIGKTLQDEEKYLELISDIDAADETKFINFTDWDYLTVQSWRRRILVECFAYYMKKRGLPGPGLRDILEHTVLKKLLPGRYERKRQKAGLDYNKGGYFNLQRELNYEIIAAYLYPARTPIIWAWLLTKEFKRLGAARFAARLSETLKRRMFGPTHDAYSDYRSLRKVVDTIAPAPATPNEQAMAPFRAGR